MNKNPYREGSNYFGLFAFIQKAPKFTREALVKFARQSLKLSEGAAEASVTVILSPRAESTRGDCRGNISSAGHLYFIEKLSRKEVKGVKGEQEYRLRWRVKPLQVKSRKASKKVSKKVKKATKKVARKSPAKKTVKAPAKAPAPASPGAPASQTPEPASA